MAARAGLRHRPRTHTEALSTYVYKCKHTCTHTSANTDMHTHVCKHQRGQCHTAPSTYCSWVQGWLWGENGTRGARERPSPEVAWRHPNCLSSNGCPGTPASELCPPTGRAPRPSRAQQRRFCNTRKVSEERRGPPSSPPTPCPPSYPPPVPEGDTVMHYAAQCTHPGLSPRRHTKTFIFQPFRRAACNPATDLR